MPLALNGYETGLLVVALVFIAFALVVALVVPRSRPEFPARRLAVFVGICVALFAAQMTAVLLLAELGEDEPEAAAEEPGGEPAEPGGEEPPPPPAEPPPAEPPPAEPPPAEPPPAGGSDPVGREVFLANCGTCHTLADAGTSGTIGPNLDASQPPEELVVDRVTNGQGAMPSFSGTLSEEQIQEVAVYVSAAAQG